MAQAAERSKNYLQPETIDTEYTESTQLLDTASEDSNSQISIA
jgi:hypothetical protein